MNRGLRRSGQEKYEKEKVANIREKGSDTEMVRNSGEKDRSNYNEKVEDGSEWTLKR